nr:protein R11G11.15 [imported] - Caenorhabditis elegans [Caenorhabditis elegans]
MPLIDLKHYFEMLETVTTSLVNLFLIYLTTCHIKKIVGTYKKMIIMFAILGILFSCVGLIVQPFAHNYNSCITMFSMNIWSTSVFFKQMLFSVFNCFYFMIVCFLAVQFIYRYLCVFDAQKIVSLNNKGCFLWAPYPFRNIILENYNISIAIVGRFSVMFYTPEGILRWKNSFMLLATTIFISFNYAIILYCGIKIHFNIKEKLALASAENKNLQQQLFVALVVQTIGPTILFVLPAVPFVSGPFLAPNVNFEINLQTGWLYSVMGMYSPFDSIAFLLIVTEYRNLIKRLFQHHSSQIEPA